MNHEINRLIHFAFCQGMLKEEDKDYAVNLLLDLFKLDEFIYEDINEELEECGDILENMLDWAIQQNMLEDTITQRDLFDTRIMNCVMPRPNEVNKTFYSLYQKSPEMATDYFYRLSIASQYIRKKRTDQNIRFFQEYKYGQFEITINLSKPEKDPKDIAKQKTMISKNYPKCLLCKENVGFSGDYQRAARQTHRIIPLSLGGVPYYLQYSPYVYYNEHCIVLNKEHQPMVINHDTFVKLISFVQQYPHYMLGSNADLPIVGGSILSHDHFQGGRYRFPIESAKVIHTFQFQDYPDMSIEILKWPLSTIRITSPHDNDIVRFADCVLKKWRNYTNEQLDIISHSQDVLHNTITPIARIKDGLYQMDLVLRNNRTNKEYPDGIFHPHPHLHHIKKENIGLIEVMGLAVLPSRLKKEIDLLKRCLLKQDDIMCYEELDKHRKWYDQLNLQYDFNFENIDDILNRELTIKFVEVLEDAGVFKMNDEGKRAFIEFVKSIESEETE